jgi:hypothetical protein
MENETNSNPPILKKKVGMLLPGFFMTLIGIMVILAAMGDWAWWLFYCVDSCTKTTSVAQSQAYLGYAPFVAISLWMISVRIFYKHDKGIITAFILAALAFLLVFAPFLG